VLFRSVTTRLYEGEEIHQCNIDALTRIFPSPPMSDIDRQRISDVKLLESLGYSFRGEDPPATAEPFTAEADAMHALLVTRADTLEGFSPNSPEETEYAAIAEMLEAYEAKRWPNGRQPLAEC